MKFIFCYFARLSGFLTQKKNHPVFIALLFFVPMVCLAGITAATFSQTGCVSRIEVTDCGGGVFCSSNYECVPDPEGTGFICAQSSCGNGILEPGEECDDGEENENLPNKCRPDCRLPYCGDGIQDSGEEYGEKCDDGNEDNTDACTNECEEARCGDGYVWDGVEECDDGNDNVNDGCPSGPQGTCRPAYCGDGFVREIGGPGEIEQCDCGLESNNLPSGCLSPNSDSIDGACRTNCKRAGCGDGNLDEGEECDQGDDNSDTEPDACRNTCRQAYCGDSVTDSDEECDQGVDNSDRPDAECRLDCTLQDCGDGIIDTNEECDNGELNSDEEPDACRMDCSMPTCGDGVTDTGEDCDDNGMDTDYCNADCTLAGCGDGYLNLAAGEQCDDGNHMVNDGCPDGFPVAEGGCQNAYCGDGFVEVGEDDCDTNGIDTFECNGSTCTWSQCGDGYLNLKAGEECDGSDLGSESCVSLGYTGGTLQCSAGCTYNTNNCTNI